MSLKQIALAISGPDLGAKSFAASRGGLCVVLTQPLPHALVKYAVSKPRRSFFNNDLFFEIYRQWLVNQAWQSYLRAYC